MEEASLPISYTEEPLESFSEFQQREAEAIQAEKAARAQFRANEARRRNALLESDFDDDAFIALDEALLEGDLNDAFLDAEIEEDEDEIEDETASLHELLDPLDDFRPRQLAYRHIRTPILRWLLTHCQIHRIPPKNTLIRAGEEADRLFYIIRGSVTVQIREDDLDEPNKKKRRPGGKRKKEDAAAPANARPQPRLTSTTASQQREIILSSLEEGEFIGEVNLFEDDGALRTATVRTRGWCEIAEISYERFRELAHKNPEILFFLAKQLAMRLRETSSKVKGFAFLDVAGRINQELKRLARLPSAMTHPDGMQVKITRQDLGRKVGCSRETVGRVMKMLEDSGYIEANGKNIVVFDVPRKPVERADATETTTETHEANDA